MILGGFSSGVVSKVSRLPNHHNSTTEAALSLGRLGMPNVSDRQVEQFLGDVELLIGLPNLLQGKSVSCPQPGHFRGYDMRKPKFRQASGFSRRHPEE